MKAVTARLPVSDGWAYEIKWDGMRAIVENGPTGVNARSSRGNDITHRFPELGALHDAFGDLDLVVDGEIVAFNADGLPSFSLLQHRMHLERPLDIERRSIEVPVVFVVFDVLRLDGTETLPLPLSDRRRLLDSLVDGLATGDSSQSGSWQLSTLHLDGGPELFEAVRERGMEGVVAKRLSSPYLSGQRSSEWVKVKARRRQEFVVGGWVSGEGNRADRIGGLMVGFYDETGLRAAGRVGSGLSDKANSDLTQALKAIVQPDSPFVDRIDPVGGRTMHYVAPTLVVEVEFGEWTPDGSLRHPVYLGRRADVEPSEVVREPDPAPDDSP